MVKAVECTPSMQEHDYAAYLPFLLGRSEMPRMGKNVGATEGQLDDIVRHLLVTLR